MKIYIYRQITLRKALIELGAKAVEAIKGILIASLILGIIFAPLIWYFQYKTSDKQACPRIINIEARKKAHCPIEITIK